MAEPTLTEDELQAAKRAGMTPERYAEMKGVRTLNDYEALNARSREDAEHERLKRAVREALDARDAAA
jgi:hypothetical protein